MTRIEVLNTLLKNTEEGKWDAFGWGFALQFNDHLIIYARRAFDGFLDAAKALHEAVLPEWGVMIKPFGKAWAEVWMLGDTETTNRPIRGTSTDPARAWLLAILRALIAQEEQQT